MKMYDCDVCLSAGSVNQWGFCEICGEEFEDPGSRVAWRADTPLAATFESEGRPEPVAAMSVAVAAMGGQDAA